MRSAASDGPDHSLRLHRGSAEQSLPHRTSSIPDFVNKGQEENGVNVKRILDLKKIIESWERRKCFLSKASDRKAPRQLRSCESARSELSMEWPCALVRCFLRV